MVSLLPKSFLHAGKSEFCMWPKQPHAPKGMQKSGFSHAGNANSCKNPFFACGHLYRPHAKINSAKMNKKKKKPQTLDCRRRRPDPCWTHAARAVIICCPHRPPSSPTTDPCEGGPRCWRRRLRGGEERKREGKGNERREREDREVNICRGRERGGEMKKN